MTRYRRVSFVAARSVLRSEKGSNPIHTSTSTFNIILPENNLSQNLLRHAYFHSFSITLRSLRFCDACQPQSLSSYRAIDRIDNPRGKFRTEMSLITVHAYNLLNLRTNSGTQPPSTATGRTLTLTERWAPAKTLGATLAEAAMIATR